ncbi:MAG TPA: FAD-dependent monooxygenase [Roseiflexaceae bacterium]|nr:FAD-dependent monooxygenase [Roseiflexaceae bacterium]
MEAIVVGAGIGGLAAAIALREAGVDVAVYERAAELREVGAGLSLWPNAIRALDRLGLGPALSAIGAPQFSGSIRTSSGRVLNYADHAQMVHRLGGPTVVLHRAELQAALTERLGAGLIQTGAELTGLAQDERGVTASFADGRSARADLLIGADGLRSTVRRLLFDDRPPRYSGYSAWRGVAAVPHTPELLAQAGELWGYGSRFGLIPMSGGRVYWFAVANAPVGQSDGPRGRKQDVLDLVRGWTEPIKAVVAATDEASILRNDIYDRPPLRRWVDGRVALLGDAAHPMTPNLGQGACQALEDAVELGRCMHTSGHVEIGLLAYQTRRRDRANAIVRQSRGVGLVAQLSHPLLCRLRDALMGAVPAEVQMRQLDWIVGQR